MMLCSALGFALALGVAACSTGKQSSAVSQASFSYSCCRAADVDLVRHPGDVVTLHWIVTALPESEPAESNQPVTLNATLHGPFSDVATLKSSPNDTSTTGLATPTIETTTWAGGEPISRIQIPSTATAGDYALSFSISTAGSGTLGGSSIIHIVTP